MESLSFQGTTSTFYPFKPGIVIKSPRAILEGPDYESQRQRIGLEFRVERQILELLGPNPRIVKYIFAPV